MATADSSTNIFESAIDLTKTIVNRLNEVSKGSKDLTKIEAKLKDFCELLEDCATNPDKQNDVDEMALERIVKNLNNIKTRFDIRRMRTIVRTKSPERLAEIIGKKANFPEMDNAFCLGLNNSIMVTVESSNHRKLVEFGNRLDRTEGTLKKSIENLKEELHQQTEKVQELEQKLSEVMKMVQQSDLLQSCVQLEASQEEEHSKEFAKQNQQLHQTKTIQNNAVAESEHNFGKSSTPKKPTPIALLLKDFKEGPRKIKKAANAVAVFFKSGMNGLRSYTDSKSNEERMAYLKKNLERDNMTREYKKEHEIGIQRLQTE